MSIALDTIKTDLSISDKVKLSRLFVAIITVLGIRGEVHRMTA